MKVVTLITLLFLSVSAFAVSARYRLKPNEQVADRCEGQGTPTESSLRMELPSGSASPAPVTFHLQLCTVSYGAQNADLTLNLPRSLFSVNNLLAMTPGQSQSANDIAWTRETTSSDGLVWYSLRFAQTPVSGMVTLEAVSFAVQAGKPRGARGLAKKGASGGPTAWSAITVRLRHRFVRDPFVLRGSRISNFR